MPRIRFKASDYKTEEPETMYGYEVREPSESEIEWFKANLNTTGMKTKDRKIIVNPHVKLSSNQRKGLLMNEASRLHMEDNDIIPDFDLTPEQEEYYQTTPYKDDVINKKRTHVGRIISGDSSAGKLTPEQEAYAAMIHKRLRNR